MSGTSSLYRCDHILGLTDVELNAALYRRWGAALGRMLPPRSKYLVTCDNRRHSEEFKVALIAGLVGEGVDVYDLGTVPTNLAAYGYGRVEAAGFAGVGGGSSPADWNGLHWTFAGAPPFPKAEQVERLRNEAENPAPPAERVELGGCRPLEVVYDWISWLQTVWYDTPQVPFRVVIDPLHGNWSFLARRALQAVFPQMFFEAIHDAPDETFGGLIPSCREPRSLSAICTEVDLRRADLGIVLDADAGCFTLVDGNGFALAPEEIAWLVLQNLGSALKNETFLHDANCSGKIIAEAERLGGMPVPVRRNEECFVAEMKKTGALIGLGSEGEIYFRGAKGNRIVLFACCWFLDYFARLGTSPAEWRNTIPSFFTTSEIRTPPAPLDEVAGRLTARWNVKPVATVEGVRFRCPFGRVDLRAIPDYAQLGFHFEADDRQTLDELVRDCSDALDDLASIGPVLNERFREEATTKLFR